MYLISIYFDDTTDKKLNSMMQNVATATGNTFMQDNHVPPHITVAAVETKHEDVLITRMEELTKQLNCGEIKFVSIGSFKSSVWYVQPILNEYLQDMSVLLANKLSGLDETILSPYYRPYSWLPHCTIAKKLSKEQMQQAFEVMQQEFVPMDAKIKRIGIAKTNPHRDIKVWEL